MLSPARSMFVRLAKERGLSNVKFELVDALDMSEIEPACTRGQNLHCKSAKRARSSKVAAHICGSCSLSVSTVRRCCCELEVPILSDVCFYHPPVAFFSHLSS
eukprot:2173453-Pleurochrysis_carterae.AAC.3